MIIEKKYKPHTLFHLDVRDDNRAFIKHIRTITKIDNFIINPLFINIIKNNKEATLLNLKKALYRPNHVNYVLFFNDGSISENEINKIALSYNYNLEHINPNSVFLGNDKEFLSFIGNCLIKDRETLFIGDIHENIEPLKELIKHRNGELVLLGDYLDKGNNTIETVEYVHKLQQEGAKVIIGNHEFYVAKRLLGEIRATRLEEEVFSSVKQLLISDIHKEQFLDIFNKSLPYVNLKYKNINYWATHAPCKVKYLGKMCENSIKKQRNFYFKNRDPNTYIDQLSFLSKPMPYNHIHIFGHVAHDGTTMEFENRLWLDTGSVYGNKLSGAIINNDGVKIVNVDSNLEYREDKIINLGTFLNVPKNKQIYMKR